MAKYNVEKVAGKVAKAFDQIKEDDLQVTNPNMSQGQPLETTMVGTKDNAAPSAVEQAAQRRQAFADKAKQFVKGVWNKVKAPEQRTFVNTGSSPDSVHRSVAPKATIQQQAPAEEMSFEDAVQKYPGADSLKEWANDQYQEPTREQKEEALLKAFEDAEKARGYQATAATQEKQGVSVADIQPTQEEIENVLVDEMVAARVPNTPPTALPADTKKPTFAVPTAEERQAWSAQQSNEPTMMAQALEDAAAATDDPKQKALYSMAAERMRELEGWQEEENAYRRGQARSAREMRDRLRTAAQRRDQREYNDQDPSWADAMRKVPMVQNTIGVRRYNPETGEMEWHYPRNAAEGVGALLTSLPQIAHAVLTGDNRLQREYRAMEQNQMFAPYKMDYQDMDDYRRGAMVQPTPTLSDRMAANIAEGSFGGLKEQQRIQGIEATAAYIESKYGTKMRDDYIKAALGIKTDATAVTPDKIKQTISAYKYALTDPEMVGSEAMNLLKLQLVDMMTSENASAADKAEIAKLLGSGRSAKTAATDVSQMKGGKQMVTQGAEYSDVAAESAEKALDKADASGNYDLAALMNELPTEAQKELGNIISLFESYLAQYPEDESGAKEYLKALLEQSGLVNSQRFKATDVIGGDTRSTGEWLFEQILRLAGRGDIADRRYREGKDLPLGPIRIDPGALGPFTPIIDWPWGDSSKRVGPRRARTIQSIADAIAEQRQRKLEAQSKLAQIQAEAERAYEEANKTKAVPTPDTSIEKM